MLAYAHELYVQFRRFPLVIRRFYLADIWFAFARSIFAAIFNLHLMNLGYTAGQMGSLQLVSSLCSAVLAIPIGYRADRIGRRPLYVLGSFLFAVPYLILPFLTSFPAVLVVNTLGMIGLLMAQVNETPLLAAEVESADRAAVFSIMMVNFMFWNMVGTQLSGFTVKWWGADLSVPYRPALTLSGVCGLISALLRSRLPFRSEDVEVTTKRSYRPSQAAFSLAVVSLFSGGFTMLIQGFGNVILADRYHLDEVAVATAMTIANAAGWAGALLVPGLSRRLGVTRLTRIVILSQGLLLPVMGWIGTPTIYQGAFWLREFLGTMQMTVWGAFAMEVAPEQERATVNSFAMVGRSLGAAFAAQAFGIALTGRAYSLAFTSAGGLALLAAGALFIFFRSRRPLPDPQP
jgi:DHA1 family multidrug resistance protein-like MFS transporter